jgi:uncharacterized membrane protein YgcG
MPRIVISYRRNDSAATAGRIADQLKARYGEDSVFMDIDNIPFGVDYRTHIKGELLKSEILVVVIGPRWFAVAPDGRQRILNEADPVRVEIETALREHVPVLPVLVDDATMPAVHELPDSLNNFAFLNAAVVDTGRDFRHHMDRLIRALDQITVGTRPVTGAEGSPDKPQIVAPAVEANRPRPTSRSWLFLAAVPLVCLLAAGLWFFGPALRSPDQARFPAYKSRVTDDFGFLAVDTRTNLTQQLIDLEAKSGVQVVFALLKTAANETADYAKELSTHWRIGGAQRNGILLVIFPNDYKSALDVGGGVAKLQNTPIPALLTERIDQRLGAKDVVGALTRGMDDIVEILTGDAKAWEVKASSLPSELPRVVPSDRPSTTYRVLPTVSGGVQNLRAGPGTAYDIIYPIPEGSTGITISTCRPSEDGKTKRPWCAASWHGYTGWISSCCIIDEATGAPPPGLD